MCVIKLLLISQRVRVRVSEFNFEWNISFGAAAESAADARRAKHAELMGIFNHVSVLNSSRQGEASGRKANLHE
jgi:hypothetical protein